MWVAEWNEVVITDETRICLQHYDGRVRVWRHRKKRMLNSCVMHWVLWIKRNDTWHSLSKGSSSITKLILLPCPARSPDLSPIENMWSMVTQRLTQITTPGATLDQLWQREEAAGSAVPQEHIQSPFELMPRRVTVVMSNNGGCSGY
ncbi:transposable element Tcb1 transposase [Trichonephila clavipes]|nr:transposable element Tcb1 transposase [Trichonephila clavipes]